MRRLLIALVLIALVSAAAMLALWLAFGSPAEGIHLIVNGHEVSMSNLAGWHAAAATLALLLALCVVAVVLPLTLLLAVLLPLLLVLGAVALVCAAVLGVGALTLSPLVVLVLLVWWLSRRSRRTVGATNRAGGNTIDA
jgi:hypothetical protein